MAKYLELLQNGDSLKSKYPGKEDDFFSRQNTVTSITIKFAAIY